MSSYRWNASWSMSLKIEFKLYHSFKRNGEIDTTR